MVDLSRIQDLACASGILSIAAHNRRTPAQLTKATPPLLLIDQKTRRVYTIDSGQDMIRRAYRRILEQLPR
jgi:hypothetical protein